MRARKLHCTVGHPLVTSRVIIKSTRSRLLPIPCRAFYRRSTMFPDCPRHCASTMSPQFPHKHFHGETLTDLISHSSLESRHNGNVRPVYNDRFRGVIHTTQLGFPARPLSIFPKWTKPSLRDSLTFLTGTSTPNLSNFPVPAGILKHLSPVIG